MTKQATAEKKIIFYRNGNTSVTLNGRDQEPELQEAWTELFAKFLESKGQDPTTFDLLFSDGYRGRFFKTEDGWNWTYSVGKR